MPGLQKATQATFLFRGALRTHGAVVAGVSGQHLGAEHPVPTVVDQRAPEVEVLPATRDMRIAVDGLPGFTPD